jgi:hypothetical protein
VIDLEGGRSIPQCVFEWRVLSTHLYSKAFTPCPHTTMSFSL